MSASAGSAMVNAKQQLAIDVLLVGGTDAQAASAGGVSRSTVAHWRRNVPAFGEAFRTARREMLQRTRTRLHACTAVAVKALEGVNLVIVSTGWRRSSGRRCRKPPPCWAR